MELRQPPLPSSPPPRGAATRVLLAIQVVLLLGLGALILLRDGRPAGEPEAGGRAREVAARLRAAGALDEASAELERYLESAELEPQERARIAYSLATGYMELGRFERALRWLYEAELLGPGELSEEVGQKIVHSLERLGRHHAARAALESRVGAGSEAEGPEGEDPVVARIGSDEFRRSQVLAALDDLPPELAREFSAPARRREFLQKFVADALLWRKARKLEYDRDPQVLSRHARALEQLAVSRMVEREVVDRIEVDESDLRNFFEARKEHYRQPAAEGESAPEPDFEQLRALVERDYRLLKIQSAYEEMIESELAGADVELFEERMNDG